MLLSGPSIKLISNLLYNAYFAEYCNIFLYNLHFFAYLALANCSYKSSGGK